MTHAEGSPRAETIPFRLPQPSPLETHVAYRQINGTTATAIARTWRAADTPRCKLCARCTATFCDDARDELALCVMLVPRLVSKDEAPLFRKSSPGGGRDVAVVGVGFVRDGERAGTLAR